MFPEHAVRAVVEHTYYRQMMGDYYEESPWDDEHEPSNETREEAERFAEEVIHTLATGPHKISKDKLRRMDAIMCAMLDADRPITRAEGRKLTGGSEGMSGSDYDYAVGALLRNGLVAIEPLERRPAESSQRISLTQRGHAKAMELAGVQERAAQR